VLPLLYLHGLSSLDFGPALTQFLRTAQRLSPSTIGTGRTRLPRSTPAPWPTRITCACGVDGIHLKVRLEQDKVCLLVMIGLRADGTKELIAPEDGHRESTESRLDLLRATKRRGMRERSKSTSTEPPVHGPALGLGDTYITLPRVTHPAKVLANPLRTHAIAVVPHGDADEPSASRKGSVQNSV